MKPFKSIAVFCGSAPGHNGRYVELACEVGAQLAKSGIDIIYGASRLGIMGAVAAGALEQGGKVIGIIPHFLRSKEIVHEGLHRLILTETMHQRKVQMYELTDATLVLPGGFGTLDELFETLTWAQLGLHTKPIGILNFEGYFNPLISMADRMVHEGFLSQQHRNILQVEAHLTPLLQRMQQYKAPVVPRWVDKDTV
jgi:uncharacterized protein (TIGR00730 family)